MTNFNLPRAVQSAADVEVSSGSAVFLQGQSAANYLLVTEGCIKVFARSDEGREVVLYRVKPGEMCTLTTACVLGGTNYPAEAVAEVDSVAKAIPALEFERLVSNSDRFRRFVFASFSSRLSEIMQRLEELVLAGIDKRLARFLLHNSDEEGNVHATHEYLAVEIGTAREVVSRHLKSLESAGAIRLHRGRVKIISAKRLESLS